MMIKKYLQENIDKNKRIAILGAGSILRNDDAAGMYLIELLEEKLKDKENVLLAAGSTAPENFTGVIKDFKPDILIVADASQMDAEPGEAMIIPEDEISGATFSTHMLPMSVMLSYLENECNCAVHVIGIQPKSIDMGMEMCSAVKETVERIANQICEHLM